MKKSPLAEVKETFGSKENLVKELKALFDKGDLFENRLNADKGLAHVPNAKLLKLHAVAKAVAAEFKTRDKLVSEILKLENRAKDTGLKARYEKWGLPRLYDRYTTLAKHQS